MDTEIYISAGNIKDQIRRDISAFKRKYIGVKEDLIKWQQITGLFIKSKNISCSDLYDCYAFLINEQLSRERIIDNCLCNNYNLNNCIK